MKSLRITKYLSCIVLYGLVLCNPPHLAPIIYCTGFVVVTPTVIPSTTRSTNAGLVFPKDIRCYRSADNQWQRKATQSSHSVTPPLETNNGISQSIDPDYPYNFTGRLWFHPSLVRIPQKEEHNNSIDNIDNNIDNSLVSNGVKILSLFGYTLGGSVCLEYDTSPVGPYREYVTMSALVMKRGTIGQWGSRLYVSTSQAERVCRDVWGVPAEIARIDFGEEGERLFVTLPPDSVVDARVPPSIRVEGWKHTRIVLDDDDDNNHEDDNNNNEDNDDLQKESGKSNSRLRRGNLPVYWTPTIKALWFPFVPFRNGSDGGKNLPLHRLRLSASAIRFHWSGIERRDDVGDVDNDNSEKDRQRGIPLGLGLVVDNVLIEIGKRSEEDL